MFTRSLQHRHRQPEIMDQPNLEEHRHVQALRGLERINRFTGSVRIVWPALQQAAQRVAPAPLRVLDVATGAGDMLLRLWRKAKSAAVPLDLSGCDISATALDHARHAAEKAAVPVRFFQADILGQPLPETYDVVMCSLFMHHLSEEETVRALQTMKQAARSLVLVHDLRRSSAGWWLAYLGTRLLSLSPIVHFDGPVSVEGAYTCAEMLQLAQRAGLAGATVTRRWPCRFLLTAWQ